MGIVYLEPFLTSFKVTKMNISDIENKQVDMIIQLSISHKTKIITNLLLEMKKNLKNILIK